MTKCPKGTPSQIKANVAYINRLNNLLFDNSSWGHGPPTGQMLYVEEKEMEATPPESDELELDSNKADKRNPPTARDELVYFFMNYFLDILLESWEGKPCVKRKLGPALSVPNEFEMFGEDLGPCEFSIVLSTADYLKDLYQKRTFNLSKEKFKKGSYSTESEYLNEEDFEPPDPELWKTFEPDEDVHFVFVNGVWYKGRVSRKMMEGEGFYFWEDGTTYQGEFEDGCVTGKGRLEFPDLSVYEGGVYNAFRHGEGIFCFSESPVMYTGQWWLGKKHGHGLIVYNDPSESQNFYRGQWQDGFKEGFGFRQYPSGARYIGFWSNGKRHGRGVMFWNNNDIYRGDWKEGQMHGYGEYTWNGFVNRSLSYPASNTFRGYWANGKRNGKGLFELKSGSLIETIWVENMKEGSGAVVCKNGSVVVSEKLFIKDKPGILVIKGNGVESESLKDLTAKPNNENENQMSNLTLEREDLAKNNKIISIPIHLPVQTLNLNPHIYKHFCQKKKKIIKSLMESDWELHLAKVNPKAKETEKEMFLENPKYSLTNAQMCHMAECNLQEEKHLRNFITCNMCALRACYDYYATLACEKPPTFKCVLLRMFLWQMLIDGEVPSWNLSLIDIDCILACEDYLLIENPHDPFERILFWQFIQSLIVLSWHLYGQYVSVELPILPDDRIINFLQYFENCECTSVLKIAFEYFIEKNVFKGRFREDFAPLLNQGNKFEEGDLAPMEAVYFIYCSIGEPHSARDFVNAICQVETKNTWKSSIVRYFEKLPFFKVEGKNALTVAGELQHIPGQKPFNFPEIFKLEENKAEMNPKSEMTCFKGLKAKRVIKCLTEVCHGIMNDGFVVNMDYQLTFLEFYRTIILCIKLQLKMKAMNSLREDIIARYKTELEEYNRQLNELEKLKESAGVSRKKSRQFPPDLSKKAKK